MVLTLPTSVKIDLSLFVIDKRWNIILCKHCYFLLILSYVLNIFHSPKPQGHEILKQNF